MTPNLYTNTAKLYDTGNDRTQIAGDLEFYMSMISADASVLEVGCGTGRMAIALAERGNFVTGIDLSQEMLDVFQNKLKDHTGCSDRIDLHRMDMRHLNLCQTFDWIIFPFRVFQALTSHEDRLACLSAVSQHMTKTSRLILTLFNPKKSILYTWGKKDILDFEQVEEVSGRKIRRYQDQMWHDADKQIIAARLRYEIYNNGSSVERLNDDLELGYLYPDQCNSLFAECKLVVMDSYGHYDRRALSKDEQMEQIYILKKLKFEQSNEAILSR